MCKIKIRYLLMFLLLIISSIYLNDSSKINASYQYCDTKVAGTEYYDCGSFAYTYPEDFYHSSMIVSLDSKSSILYAGEKDNIHIFYASGFRFYNVTYDDRSRSDNNIWTIITSKGSNVYNGSFDDSILIDESHRGYVNAYLFADVYTIRQYINDGELYRTIVVYNFDDSEITFKDAYYDGEILDSSSPSEVTKSYSGFKVDVESKYGLTNLSVTINDVEVKAVFDGKNISLDSSVINEHLVMGKNNTIKITGLDHFGVRMSKTYKLLYLNNNASISFSTITSVIESSSRRIVINASPGKGKSIDNDYCWYYWSKSEDDSLTYDDFLKNYASSSYKGSYSEGKGVILRNTSGTYYLYALAKDDDSYIVVRSEGYVLNNAGYKVNYSIKDAILLVSLMIVAIAPISIYLYIRKKGY